MAKNLWLLLVLLSLPVCVGRAEEPPACGRLRRAIDSKGCVVERDLGARTGWRALRAFTWRLEVAAPSQPGVFLPADAARTFHSGERFRIQIEAFCDLFMYVGVEDADGSRSLLLPLPDEKPAQVRRGQKIMLPPDGTAFRFQPPGGTHRLRIVAAPVSLSEAGISRFWSLQTGQAPPGSSAGAPADVSAARGEAIPSLRGLESVLGRIDRGTLAKGVVVEVTEGNCEANLVGLATADADSPLILVHEIAIRQGS